MLQKEKIVENFKSAASLLVLANLPCSHVRFERMQVMVLTALTLLGDMMKGSENEAQVNASIADCMQ